MLFKQIIYWRLYAFLILCVSSLMISCGKETFQETESSQLMEAVQDTKINAWGEVKYQDNYQIIINFPAIVDEINVKEGDVVHKGDVLAVLDTREFDKTIAKLEDQKLAGDAALTGIHQDTDGLKARIEQQKRNIATAQHDWNNAKILYEAGDISKFDYDKYVANLEIQKTEQKVLETQLLQMETSNSSNSNQQASTNAALEKELDIYKERLRKPYLNGNQIVSNVENGIIKAIYVEYGSVLGEEMGLVMEIIDQDSIYISAEIDEEFIKDITLQTPVRIVPVMDPSIEISGTVSQIAAMAVEKDGGRIVKVRVIPDDLERVLIPGYTVDAYFIISEG